MSQQPLNYSTHTYLAITFSPSSPYLTDPSTLHPGLQHTGQVGQLHDIQLFAVPNNVWQQSGEQIRAALDAKRGEGVLRVDVQEPRGRAKRDEL